MIAKEESAATNEPIAVDELSDGNEFAYDFSPEIIFEEPTNEEAVAEEIVSEDIAVEEVPIEEVAAEEVVIEEGLPGRFPGIL